MMPHVSVMALMPFITHLQQHMRDLVHTLSSYFFFSQCQYPAEFTEKNLANFHSNKTVDCI